MTVLLQYFFRNIHWPAILLSLMLSDGLQGQDNYEIQVYGSQTQAPGSTMFELHSNYTISGSKQIEKGVLPTNHALHETLEITTGVSRIIEVGFYFFTNYTPGYGYQYVGSHVRPRIMAPPEWNLPFGLSLSMEIGWQKPAYSEDEWSWEIRPIIDKQWSRLYLSFNPTLGVSLKSQYNNSVPTFEPNLKIGYSLLKNASFGIEYYGDCGPFSQFEPVQQQNHSLFITYDLLNNPYWELNIGLGFGLTSSTDPLIFKVILGRRVKWKS
ncbi:MAG: hypothetical protein ACHQET_03290 [Chitinophagales bacterium]